MGKHWFVMAVIMLLLMPPAVASADCLDLGRANNYYVEGSHGIIFYAGMRPIAFVTIPYCLVYSDSSIRLSRSYMCDTDRIIVDGSECVIGSISSTATTPLF